MCNWKSSKTTAICYVFSLYSRLYGLALQSDHHWPQALLGTSCSAYIVWNTGGAGGAKDSDLRGMSLALNHPSPTPPGLRGPGSPTLTSRVLGLFSRSVEGGP